MPDTTEELMQSLPPINQGESFCFKCHPSIKCFNECCKDLCCALSPYDVNRLRRSLKIPSRQFLKQFTDLEVERDVGFPHVTLKMRKDDTCPFVSEKGCTVYSDRPGACRTYPLGRGASMSNSGKIEEQYVLVREDHCMGFREDQSWTIDSWIQNQVIKDYDTFNDQYLTLVTRLKNSGKRLNKGQFSMVHLSLYHLDEFLELIRQEGWLDHLDMPEPKKKAVLEDETERLSFAFKWLENVLLGKNL